MSLTKYRPHSLRILGREFQVDYEEEMDGNYVGFCYAQEGVIEIKEDQHPMEEADTILHEALHALFYLLDLGLSRTREERVVRLLSTGLIQVFADNPEFLNYLTKVVKANNRGV